MSQVYPKQYLEQAVENNPGLRAQYLWYEIALEQPDIVGGLPSPEFTAGVYTPPMQRLMGNQVIDAGLMQMFPWFGTLSARRAAAGKTADATYEQYRQQRNNLFVDITQSWLDIYETEKQMQIILRFTEILKAREDIIYTRYSGGIQSGGLALDILRLEMQINELDNRYERLQENYLSQVSSFNILLNRQHDANVEIPDTLMPLDAVAVQSFPDTTAFEANPMVSQAIAQAEAAEFEQQLARLMTRPMFGLGLQYSHFAPGEAAMGQMDGGSMVMPMISFTIPIYGKQNRASRNRGSLMAQRAIVMTENQLDDVASQWWQLSANLNNLWRDQRFLIRQSEISQNAWELVLNAYTGGQESFDELLRIENQLLELEQRMLETIVKQHQAAAMMDMLMGREVFE